MNVIVTINDKIQSMKRCELSTVIITVRGSFSLVAVYTVWSVLKVLSCNVKYVRSTKCDQRGSIVLYVWIINCTRCTVHTSKSEQDDARIQILGVEL